MNLTIEKTTGYFTESELSEFRKVIDEKLEQAKKQFHFYQEQIFDFTDMMGGEQQEWADENLIMKDIELLTELVQAQIGKIEKLEKALRRIRQKRFGICEVTGKLMDKKSLLADPVKTNSLITETQVSDQFFEDIFLDFNVGETGYKNVQKEEEISENYISLDDIAEAYGFEEEYNL